jgi:anti-sigma regulatory factor (Ser/Thr protein kinase)
MTTTAIATDPMIAFTLVSAPESVGKARVHVRVALEYQGLGIYADDAETVASELVSNSVQHVRADITDKISVVLMRVQNPSAVAIVVKDASIDPPVMREVIPESQGGRGLRIVEALSVYWTWNLEDGGKAVTAILAKEEAE